MDLFLNENDLKIIKELELSIAKEVKRICDKYNIKYSLTYGTLLGAVRHGGFIPWDDDIDIAMIRNEYDKFLAVCKKELKSQFYIVNYDTNKYCGVPHTKIMIKNTLMEEAFTRKSLVPKGVFIDIFPFDSTPEGKIKKLIHRYRNYELIKRILLKSDYEFDKQGIKKAVYFLLKIMTIAKKETLIKKYRNNEKKYNNERTKEVVALGGAYGYYKDTIPRSWLEEYTIINFEGVEFSVYKNYEEVLTHYYSDYMVLPPKELQVAKHKVQAIDLTNFGGRKVKCI